LSVDLEDVDRRGAVGLHEAVGVLHVDARFSKRLQHVCEASRSVRDLDGEHVGERGAEAQIVQELLRAIGCVADDAHKAELLGVGDHQCAHVDASVTQGPCQLRETSRGVLQEDRDLIDHDALPS